MAGKHLGDVFDIHGGGIDLTFPHHENEIAQSRCAHDTDVMARVWMHNGFLQVEGEKMSKSLGNFITINELLETTKFGGRKWPGEVLRLAMLMTHYRQPIDWTVLSLTAARNTLIKWYTDMADMDPAEPAPSVIAALSDDLNTPRAIAELHVLRSKQKLPEMKATLLMLGFGCRPSDINLMLGRANILEDDDTLVATGHLGANDFRARVDSLIAARLEARKRKDFKESDRIRDELAGMGVTLKDTKNKDTGEIETTWELLR
jgi:cysteinyl-tRNA synthetase